MRFAVLALLIPALASAQDVPSLQRPNPALPITESIPVLQSRLGQIGGNFAAAQLALKGTEGLRVLLAAKNSPQPLVRLDAAFGLNAASCYPPLISLMGDSDPQVSGEAYTSIKRVHLRIFDDLRYAAFHDNDAAGNAAVSLLEGPEAEETILKVAMTAGSPGRAAALGHLGWSNKNIVPILESAVHDPRPGVANSALVQLFYSDKIPARAAAIERLSNSSEFNIRLAMATVIQQVGVGSNQKYLLRLGRDPSPAVRLRVIDALTEGLFQTEQLSLILPSLAQLSQDPVPNLGDHLVKRLGEFLVNREGQFSNLGWATKPAAAGLRKGVGKRLNGPLKVEAALILALVKDRRAYPILVDELEKGNAYAAIMGLGILGDHRASAHLLQLTNSQSYGGNAYAALGFLRDPATVPPLIRILRQDPEGRGYSAAGALAAIGDRRATPALLAAAGDEKVNLGSRLAFFNPLAQLGGPGVRDFLLAQMRSVPENWINAPGDALVRLRDFTAIPELEKLTQPANTQRAATVRHTIEMLRQIQKGG